MHLHGREIVLAGGAGGLGSATAEALVSEGARCIVSYRADRDRASRLVDVASVVQCDLTSADDRVRLLDEAPHLYGVVVFAGAPSRVKEPSQMEKALRDSLEVNCIGPLMLAREAADRMRENGVAGSIVLFSTMQSVSVFAGSTAYAVAKAALQHGALILAKEVRAAGIRVNVVAPGVTAAGMAEASIAAGKYDGFLKEGRVSRFGKAEDVSRAVRFLLQPDNYVTGQVLSVDGGAALGV